MFLTKNQTIALLKAHNQPITLLPKKGKIVYLVAPGALTTIQKSDQKSVYGQALYEIKTPIIEGIKNDR